MILRIGSRGSLLAMEQARIIEDLLCKHSGTIKTEIIEIQTSGDLFVDKPVDSFGGKGVFTREIDAALLENRIDLAVHSLKDMPTPLPDGLVVSAYCSAEDPRDALVLPHNAREIDMTKPAGSSAKRRSVQLAALYPRISCAPIRGNVPTRIAKLDSGEYGAVLLALAGLKRLGLEGRASRIFSTDEMMPAAGQGILAVVTRKDGEAAELAVKLDEPPLRRRALAERSFTDTLGGGCGLPVAAFAVEEDGGLALNGGWCPPGQADFIKLTIKGDAAEPELLGQRLAFRMLAETARRENRLGSVALVGAGPGDAGLLTLRGEAVLGGAELVVFDRLAGAGVLAKIPRNAEKIYAGKECGLHELPQEEINALLVKNAAAGLRVVRLKGGDPMLFGRGSEEALCLSDAGIPCEIVPGVSSAIAVPSAAGIPLTHRGIASSLHIIAAHGAVRSQGIDFPLLARQCSGGDTLIFMMGASRLLNICGELINAGLSGDAPAAIVSQGTTAREKKLIATVATLAAGAAEAGIKTPALIVVGETCRLEQAIAAYREKPLAGFRIAVTRPRGGINRLAKMLDSQGAEVIELPTIKIVRLDAPLLKDALAKPPLKTWLAFTSVHGVEAFFAKLAEYGMDIRALAAFKFAAVGDATCQALALRGIVTDLVPDIFTGAALGTALADAAAKDETVILPRSAIGGKELPDALSAAGIKYIDIPVYDTVPETGYENPAYRAKLTEGLDCAAFTSPSAVEGFVKIFGDIKTPALCIGEATALPARERGMEVIVPQAASLDGMVKAIVAYYDGYGDIQNS